MMHCKIYVEVKARFDRQGVVEPLAVIWRDGREYVIERIEAVRRVASLKAGGLGWRYTIVVEGQQRFLYYEEPRWFVEGRD